jgi:hexosaminidase
MRIFLHFARALAVATMLAALASLAVASPARTAAETDGASLSSALIPAPAISRAGQGDFTLAANTPVLVLSDDPEAVRTARYFAAQLARARGTQLHIRSVATASPSAVVFQLDPKAELAAEEGYVLDVSPTGVRISARHPHGLFNGAVSLLQLAIVDGSRQGPIRIPAQHIEDQPRFSWRGLMLDSARHMQTPEEIKRFIDAMALHKLNVFQWHLTDDQGWRLQILKYPRLTEIGAWRIPAGTAGIDAKTGKPVRYGGFYTQDQVREIVRYAAERYIAVVPEIDMPGHAQAAIAAYPEFGTVPAPGVSHDWGVHNYLFNNEEKTFVFLEDVMTEVLALFPSQYIHIGGDETVKDQWKASARVQQRMRELGVPNETAMQAYLTARMQKFLAARGRRLIGWDEILEGGLPADAAVMSWRGVDGAVAATATGHDSVLSPWPTLYFDNPQGTGAGEPPGRINLISLETVYRFDPLPATISAEQAKHLLGVQGDVWTEHIRTADRVQWMSFPRAAAIAEMGWSTPEHRSWPDFLRRLPALYASYDALGIVHADSSFAVLADTHYLHEPERARVSLSTQTGAGDIHYTLDGSEPKAESPRYRQQLTLNLPTTLAAASFSGKQRLSRTIRLPLTRAIEQRRTSAQLKLCSEGIALDLEDDAPARGPRAVFAVDIQNPCWLFEQADLDNVRSIAAAVGAVPFNFQIGEAAAKIQFAKPLTPAGELLVMLDRCDGEEIARIPLAPAAASSAVTVLPAFPLPRRSGRHDLCLRFSQHRLDPIDTLDWVQLLDASPHARKR